MTVVTTGKLTEGRSHGIGVAVKWTGAEVQCREFPASK